MRSKIIILQNEDMKFAIRFLWNLFGSSCAFTVSPFLAPYSCVRPHTQPKLLCFTFGPKVCSREGMVFLRLLYLNGCL